MIRTAIMLSTLTAILLAIGFFFAGVFGMTIALVLAFAINFVSYWYSDKIVLRMYRAKESDDKELNEIVGRLARDAEMPKPKVYIVPSEIPNAFATGRNPKHSAVAVTEGLKEDGTLLVNTAMSPAEIREVTGFATGRVFTVDASHIAIDEMGREITNTPMLGAFASATGIFEIGELTEQLREWFGKKVSAAVVEANVRALRRAAEEVSEG